MITKLIVKNFKKLEESEFLLDNAVVFVGPNNSGKTSALQAIALWDLGMRKWAENRKNSKAKQRVGVSINRKDILSIPVPSALQLWNDLKVRKSELTSDGKRGTKNILMEIYAEGFTQGKIWKLGFEFDYQNAELIFCRISQNSSSSDTDFPEIALQENLGFLPPMSGLAAIEDKLEPGSIKVRIGEGRTAEVLRNLCWNIFNENPYKWDELSMKMNSLFHVKLEPPNFDAATGRISMTYKEGGHKEFDISNSGRGFQQILLLLSYIYSGKNNILLLDEPDAHLEIIRQKEIYNLLTDLVKQQNNQIIVATHSEAILNEAAQRDRIIAFLGNPHIVNNNSQLVKSLTTFGFENYLLATQKQWVLYLEGSTDLSLLQAFAEKLKHPVYQYLDDSFTVYVSNAPNDARNHFYALQEAVPKLKGFALFDRISSPLQQTQLKEVMWERREIENYIPIPEVLLRFAAENSHDLFSQNYVEEMEKLITDYIPPVALRDKNNDWWINTKISDGFLDVIFREFSFRLGIPIIMSKGKYSELIKYANEVEILPEVKNVLDQIFSIACDANINSQIT